MRRGTIAPFALAFSLLFLACDEATPPAPRPAGSSPTLSAPSASSLPSKPASQGSTATRVGASLVRAADGKALFVVDEQHNALRRLPLPLSEPADAFPSTSLPGPPAQVLSLPGKVLVTVRNPGLLLVFSVDATGTLTETQRVALPADAWGLAVNADETLALVSCAYSHAVSAVDLASGEKRWTVDVAREPRGIAINQAGTAYVSHLVGADLTRIDALTGSPQVHRVMLPASPLRTPSGVKLSASLGYSASFSPDERRLFVARHALGALGRESWFGAATVDVLLTSNDEPLAPLHHGNLPIKKSDLAAQMVTSGQDANLPMVGLQPFTQPRAIVYRKSTHTLLVAGEGDDRVAELDALAVDPTLARVHSYLVGRDYDAHIPVASKCAGPAGLALSEDESTLWVHCQVTNDVAEVKLLGYVSDEKPVEPRIVRFAEDPLDADAAKGRRLFYNATDQVMSGGLACAGCHPEGRDDGFVWREATFVTTAGPGTMFVGTAENIPDDARRLGAPRRTPLLAGRVDAQGPYGWHAESPTIVDRMKAGFGLHRWGPLPKHTEENLAARAGYVVAYLRKGLVLPPRDAPAADDKVARGKAIFMSEEARCSKCHVPETGYTDRMGYPFPKWPVRKGFDDEKGALWKTPSLRFVGGRAPYFHDGSAGSLAELVRSNNDRMGRTNHLSPDDQAALVAFLESL